MFKVHIRLHGTCAGKGVEKKNRLLMTGVTQLPVTGFWSCSDIKFIRSKLAVYHLPEFFLRGLQNIRFCRLRQLVCN
jgi:hypothetical protein